MRKLLFVLAAFILVACDPDPQPLPGADTTLTRASLGSGSYYVESGAGSRAIAGGSLKYVSAGTLGTVSFTDADGNEASVVVSNALALSTGGLVIEATYLEETSAYITPVSGDLVELVPSPDGWDYARDDGTYLYYIADAGLYRAPLATGVGVLMSGADSLSAGAWLKVTSYGGVVYVNPDEPYYMTPGTTLGPAQRFYPSPESGGESYISDRSLPNPATENAIESLDGRLYKIGQTDRNLLLYEYTESDTLGSLTCQDPVVLCVLPESVSVYGRRLSSRSVTNDVTLGFSSPEPGGYIRVWSTSTGFECTVTMLPSELYGASFVTMTDALDAASGSDAYHAFYETPYFYGDGYNIEKWHIIGAALSDTSSRALTTTGEILSDYNVTALQPLGGLLFYQRDAGSGVQTMVYDGTGVEVYANGAVSIEAVE